MFVCYRACSALHAFFVPKFLDDPFDNVGKQIACDSCTYSEEYGNEHGVKKLGTFGLGEVSFGEGSGYVVFIPGVCEFFRAYMKVGRECDLICLVVHGCSLFVQVNAAYFLRLAACGGEEKEVFGDTPNPVKGQCPLHSL